MWELLWFELYWGFIVVLVGCLCCCWCALCFCFCGVGCIRYVIGLLGVLLGIGVFWVFVS